MIDPIVREALAVKALELLINNRVVEVVPASRFVLCNKDGVPMSYAKRLARLSFEIADAMIEERGVSEE